MEKYILKKHGQSTFRLLEITETVHDDSKSERSLVNQLE